MEKDNPQDWKSTTDPATGRTYWYHRKTRVSTWTKPEILKELEIATVTSAPPVATHVATQHLASIAATSSSKSIKSFEENGYRFYPTFTTNDHSLLTKIFLSFHQQQTLENLSKKTNNAYFL